MTEIMTKEQWQAVLYMKPLGIFGSQKEAFRALYEEIKKTNPAISAFFWESTWIEPVPSKATDVLLFEEIRDKAADEGWIQNGKWVL